MKQLKEHLYYVGAADPDLRIFDIIVPADCGTTYNAYLVRGEKTALIETVHASFSGCLIENIGSVCDIKDIDYVVCNHTEPDHSGSLAALLDEKPDITVYGSFAAVKNLKSILNREFKSVAARNGSSLDLGGITLNFISAPNLHWPDSMFTYSPELKTVFTCDFLGAHYSGAVTDDEITDMAAYDAELKKYYDCIFGPFGEYVKKGADILRGLDFDTVCTSHGSVLSKYIEHCLSSYEKWSEPALNPGKISVFYTSAYGYTKAMAMALAKGAEKAGAEVSVYNLIESSAEEISEAIAVSAAYMIGSPTLNRDAVKPVWDLMSMISAVSCRGRGAFIFGSYGWSGEACANLAARAEGIGLNVFGEPAKICFKPSDEDIESLISRGFEFAGSVLG